MHWIIADFINLQIAWSAYVATHVRSLWAFIHSPWLLWEIKWIALRIETGRWHGLSKNERTCKELLWWRSWNDVGHLANTLCLHGDGDQKRGGWWKRLWNGGMADRWWTRHTKGSVELKSIHSLEWIVSWSCDDVLIIVLYGVNIPVLVSAVFVRSASSAKFSLLIHALQPRWSTRPTSIDR